MSAAIWEGDRWRIRFTDDTGKRKSFTSRKEGLAGKREVLRKYREYQENGFIRDGKVSNLWNEFLEAYVDRKGECEQYIKIVKIGREHILPAIGDKYVTKLKYKDWQAVISNARPISKNKESLSKKSLINIRGVLTQFIKYCVVNEYMDQLKDSLYIPEGHKESDKQILQPEEIKKLFEPNDMWYANYFRFLVLTGLRPSEAMGLKWEDISETGLLTIKRAVNYRGMVTEGKNKNARRQFILIEPAKDVLNDQKNKTEHLGVSWVFPNMDGGIGSQEVASHQYGRITRNFTSKTTPYCLRHTFISMLKALPVELVKQVVGHSEFMQTFDTYGHMVNGESEKTAKLIESTLISTIG